MILLFDSLRLGQRRDNRAEFAKAIEALKADAKAFQMEAFSWLPSSRLPSEISQDPLKPAMDFCASSIYDTVEGRLEAVPFGAGIRMGGEVIVLSIASSSPLGWLPPRPARVPADAQGFLLTCMRWLSPKSPLLATRQRTR